ncbi:DUF2510 domain-containing protein [Streptomyces misionensis]|uniref:DUF2510 domain-containing protein n=1 Tax=Streptomyces misionensis TaxID=67331 RepID=UPI00367F8B2C
MTQVTPPGWYPDPGQTQDGPPTERWWDGAAWTDRIRPAGTAATWGPPAATPPTGGAASDQAAPAGPASPAGAAPNAEEAAGSTPQAPADGTPPGPPAPPAGQAPPAFPGAPVPPVGPVHDAPSAPQPPQGAPAYQGYPSYSGYPAYPAPPPPPARRGLRTGIAVAAAVVVLASIGVGVYALTNDDGGGDRAVSQHHPVGGPEDGPGGSGGSGGGQDGPGGPGDGQPSPGHSPAPKVKGGGTVPDAIDGISLPVPKGWTGEMISVGAQVTSDDSYKCPGNSSDTCTAGGAYTAPAVALGTEGDTPEEVAKADIAANAKESYGGASYGGITSHRVLASQAVTVAGQKGYLVRWKAVTSKGADGLVESVAFPSPNDARQMVVVRFGVDVGQNESVVDEILKGITVSSGGGSGQSV